MTVCTRGVSRKIALSHGAFSTSRGRFIAGCGIAQGLFSTKAKEARERERVGSAKQVITVSNDRARARADVCEESGKCVVMCAVERRRRERERFSARFFRGLGEELARWFGIVIDLGMLGWLGDEADKLFVKLLGGKLKFHCWGGNCC